MELWLDYDGELDGVSIRLGTIIEYEDSKDRWVFTSDNLTLLEQNYTYAARAGLIDLEHEEPYLGISFVSEGIVSSHRILKIYMEDNGSIVAEAYPWQLLKDHERHTSSKHRLNIH